MIRNSKSVNNKFIGNQKKLLFLVLFLISSVYVGFLFFKWYSNKHQHELPKELHFSQAQKNAIHRVEKNYGKEVNQVSKEYNLPSAYIKALIVLECSGHKNIKPRFENHVFTSLQNVRDGNRSNYYNLKKNKLKNMSDKALKNLASSWGPFQLMGYQVFNLGIKIHNIRGEKSVYWGIKWINQRYGNKLKKKYYKDCFHIHNAGYPLPKNKIAKTHDKNYIPNGLKYIKAFQLLEKN